MQNVQNNLGNGVDTRTPPSDFWLLKQTGDIYERWLPSQETVTERDREGLRRDNFR